MKSKIFLYRERKCFNTADRTGFFTRSSKLSGFYPELLRFKERIAEDLRLLIGTRDTRDFCQEPSSRLLCRHAEIDSVHGTTWLPTILLLSCVHHVHCVVLSCIGGSGVVCAAQVSQTINPPAVLVLVPLMAVSQHVPPSQRLHSHTEGASLMAF